MKSIRICIPIPEKSLGGMYTFMGNWRHWLEAQDIFHTDDPWAEYDILFTNSFMVPYSLIKKVKKDQLHVRVVQRVDGSAQDYGRLDNADERQARVNMLTDLTIFQSDYSKFSTTQKFKVIRQDGPIIYNPVNIQRFHPDGPTFPVAGNIKVCNASFSTNRKKGTWKISTLAEQNPDVTFILCGRYPDLSDLQNIKLLGHLGRDELASVMRTCDLFLNLSENDPCPNVVLEALASGLPVLYRDSGGTPELVGECGLPVTVENFRSQLELVFQDRDQLSLAARSRALRCFSPDHIFSQYLRAIKDAERQPLPTAMTFLRAQYRGYPVIPNPLIELTKGFKRLRRKVKKLLRAFYQKVA